MATTRHTLQVVLWPLVCPWVDTVCPPVSTFVKYGSFHRWRFLATDGKRLAPVCVPLLVASAACRPAHAGDGSFARPLLAPLHPWNPHRRVSCVFEEFQNHLLSKCVPSFAICCCSTLHSMRRTCQLAWTTACEGSRVHGEACCSHTTRFQLPHTRCPYTA